MTDRKAIERIMRFLVHHSFMFTVAVMAFVHATLLGITAYAGVTPLAVFNMFSVCVYLICALLCRRGYIMPVYVSILLEVCVYAIVSVYLIGWNSGAHYFMFSIVPILIYFGCYLFKGPRRWIIVMSLLLIFLLYACMYIGHADMKPVYPMADEVRAVLTILSAFAMFFAMVFYSIVYIYSSEFEMSSLEEKNEQLTEDARVDALTGLLNRRGFIPLVDDLMKGGHDRPFCVAFCDLDNFKSINDSYGHDCGDEVLLHVSRIIKSRSQDWEICRWGGEEIVILLKGLSLGEARARMEEIRRVIESTPTIFFNKRVRVTVTIGLEEHKESYREPEDIIRVADERMYYGKQHGKNTLICGDRAS